MTYFEAMNKCYDEKVKIKRPCWDHGCFIHFACGMFVFREFYVDEFTNEPIIKATIMHRAYGYSNKKLNNANVIIPDFLGGDVRADDWIVAVPGLTL